MLLKVYINLEMLIITQSVCSREASRASIIITSKAGAYLILKHLSGAPLLALPTNIRLGWKAPPGKGTSFLQTFVRYCRKMVNTFGPLTMHHFVR